LAKCNAVAVKHKSLLESICVNAFCKLHTAKSLFDSLFRVAGVHFSSLLFKNWANALASWVLVVFFCNIRILFSGLRFYYTFSHKWIPVFGCRCNVDVAHRFLQYSSLSVNNNLFSSRSSSSSQIMQSSNALSFMWELFVKGRPRRDLTARGSYTLRETSCLFGLELL
jgi:hypothetical protein